MTIFTKDEHQLGLVRSSVKQSQILGLAGMGVGCAMMLSIVVINPRTTPRDRVLGLGLSFSGSVISLLSSVFISGTQKGAEYLSLHDYYDDDTVATQIETDAAVKGMAYQNMQQHYNTLMTDAYSSTEKMQELGIALSQSTSEASDLKNQNNLLMYQLKKYEEQAQKIKEKNIRVSKKSTYFDDSRNLQTPEQYLVETAEKGGFEQEALPEPNINSGVELYDLRNHVKCEMTGAMIGGDPGSAKTSCVVEMVGLLTEDEPGIVTVCDHHANEVWFDELGVVPIVDIKDIYNTVLEFSKELDRRKQLKLARKSMPKPRVLIIDELIALKSNLKIRHGSEVVQVMGDILTNLAIEGRKFGIYTMMVSHSTNGGDAGMSAAMRNVSYTTVILGDLALTHVERVYGRDSDEYRFIKTQPYKCYVSNRGVAKHLTHSHHQQFKKSGAAPRFTAKRQVLVEDVPFTYGNKSTPDGGVIIDI